jgi:hypothetical protein
MLFTTSSPLIKNTDFFGKSKRFQGTEKKNDLQYLRSEEHF